MKNNQQVNCQGSNTMCNIAQPTYKTNNSATLLRSSRRQSTKKWDKLAKSLRLAAMVFWVCLSGVSWGQLTISADATWSGTLPTGYEAGITIENGAVLTIDGLTLTMNQDAEIIVELSSQLLLKNSIIKSLDTETWSGITAMFNSKFEQFSVFPDPKSTNNTMAWSGVLVNNVTLVNLSDSKIVNAVNGVHSSDGAVIRTRNSEFINCHTGVVVDSYKSKNCPNANACYFMNTSFLWNNSFNQIDGLYPNIDYMGIVMDGLSGINIGGCTFENMNDTKFCYNERGTGIKANNTNFVGEYEGDVYLHENIDGENCGIKNGIFGSASSGNVFRRLSYGVNLFSNEGSVFVLKGAEFYSCLFSLYASGYKTSGIIKNQFVIDRNRLNSIFRSVNCVYSNQFGVYGIWVDGGDEYRLIGNTFEGTSPNIFCMKLAGLGTGETRIKSNTFTSTHDWTNEPQVQDIVGICVQTACSNLQISCNTFVDLGDDIVLQSGSQLTEIGANGKDGQNTFTTKTNLGMGASTSQNNIDNGSMIPVYLLENNGSYSSVSGSHTLKPVNQWVNCGTLICDDYIIKSLSDLDCNKTSSIAHVGAPSQFSIYPIPTEDHLFFSSEFSQLGECSITIYSVLGKEVFSQKIDFDTENKITLALSAGNYLVRIANSDMGSVINKKIIIQ